MDISAQVSAMNNLSTQIAEMKIKFEEIERQREKLDEEKEKRFKEFADSMHKMFKELSEKKPEWMKKRKQNLCLNLTMSVGKLY